MAATADDAAATAAAHAAPAWQVTLPVICPELQVLRAMMPAACHLTWQTAASATTASAAPVDGERDAVTGCITVARMVCAAGRSHSELARSLLPAAASDPEHAALVDQWLTYTQTTLKEAIKEPLQPVDPAVFERLNAALAEVTWIAGGVTPTLADVFLYALMRPWVARWDRRQQTEWRHVTRWLDLAQHWVAQQHRASQQLAAAHGVAGTQTHPLPYPLLTICLEPLPEVLAEQAAAQAKAAQAAKAAKSKTKGKDAAAAASPDATKASTKPAKSADAPATATAAAGSKKADKKADKKDKKADKKPAAAAEKPAAAADASTEPWRLDLRVGKVVKVEKHPDAESLYVEQIDLGEPTGPRTVCSGLVKHMPMEAIDGQLLVIVCNLKPVKMRGVTSQAMVLCANTPEAVEFVRPPAGATPGTPVYFEGFEDQAATDQPLNPKKKVFESIQPLLKTDDQRQAAYFGTDGRVRLLRTKEGVCQADTLVGAAIR